MIMDFKDYIKNFGSYSKDIYKRLILLSILIFYFAFLYMYNLFRSLYRVETSWYNGLLTALVITIIFIPLIAFIGFSLKLEFIKGHLKSTLILAVLGTSMLFLAGLIGIMISFPTIILAYFIPFVLSINAFIGIFLVLWGKKYGNFLIYTSGTFAIFFMLIPLFPLNLSLLYIDPFLIVIGGILGLLLKE